MKPSHEAMLEVLRAPAGSGPAASAAGPAAVETVETHMSWVFLLADRVLKLKKPVRYPFLDFSTLAAREAFCREEIRLDSRLAPGVYRGLLALQRAGDRFVLVPEAQLAERRDVVDWVVWMDRLPRARMLDQAIADASVQIADVDAVIDVLAAFFRGAQRPAPDPDETVMRFRREQAINRQVLLHPQLRLDGAAEALDRLDDALQRQLAVLRQRVEDGRIVDGHGDLRPEHVCLLRPPVVIDCLEFNAALRRLDPFDELAYLSMECEIAGAGWIGARLIAGCAAALDDTPPAALLQLYTANRALLRARLSLAHLLDPQPRTPQRWAPQARRYLARACVALDAAERAGSGAVGG